MNTLLSISVLVLVVGVVIFLMLRRARQLRRKSNWVILVRRSPLYTGQGWEQVTAQYAYDADDAIAAVWRSIGPGEYVAVPARDWARRLRP